MIIKIDTDGLKNKDLYDESTVIPEYCEDDLNYLNNPYREAIEILEEFKIIDDWSAVYMPRLHEAIDTLINAVKEAHNG